MSLCLRPPDTNSISPEKSGYTAGQKEVKRHKKADKRRKNAVL